VLATGDHLHARRDDGRQQFTEEIQKQLNVSYDEAES